MVTLSLWMPVSAKLGDAAPTAGPASVTKAPIGATRSNSTPTWRDNAHTSTPSAITAAHSKTTETVNASTVQVLRKSACDERTARWRSTWCSAA
jgi:hypothetical protein